MASTELRQPMTMLDALSRRASIHTERRASAVVIRSSDWGTTHETAPSGHQDQQHQDELTLSIENDPELILPPRRSLVVIITGAALFQMAFFILIPSSAAYAELLGGSATFSGLVIGIPVVFGGLILLPMAKYDRGTYRWALNLQVASMIVGSILYALAYKANYLYLLLIGRMIQGFGFTSFMYAKRYITDPRIVGIRRRSTLASYLVVTQAIGFSVGPFIGGLLFKIGFPNDIWNGFTSPGWFMAGVWVVYWVAAAIFFEEPVPTQKQDSARQNPETGVGNEEIEMNTLARTTSKNGEKDINVTTAVTSSVDVTQTLHHNDSQGERAATKHHLGVRGWGTIICMCWFAMLCFLILGAFEANIPIFAATTFGYSPYASGNFIALGGVVSFPFLFINVLYARRFQDRVILATGSTLGLLGMILFLIQLSLPHDKKITLAGFFVCWCLVALGFNIASTCTVSLLSKQLPPEWNGRLSMAIQYSNYTGRISGAVWGGAGVRIGMQTYLGALLAVVGIGFVMYATLWKELKTKTG